MGKKIVILNGSPRRRGEYIFIGKCFYQRSRVFSYIALFIHHLIPYNENEKHKCRCQNHPGSGRRAVTGGDSYTHSEALPLLHRESPAQCCCRSEGAL